MKKVFLFGIVLLLFCLPGRSQAQYQPDTMDFASFLNLCQDFSRSNRQELWVVTFWASWNSNSLYQLPALKAAYFNYRHKPIRFFFISRDRDGAIWRNTLEREQLPGTHILVRNAEDYEYLKQGFQHSSIPAMFLVDQQGNIYRIDRVQQLRDMLEEESRNLPDNYVSTDPGPGSQPARPSAPSTNVPSTPVFTPTSQPLPAQPGNQSGGYLTHTVRKSETLYSISRQYSVTVDQIRSLNSLSGNIIKVGQELKIKQL